MIQHLRADVRYAVRGLLARPGFAAVVVLTLGLGIGANTAIFSAVQGLLLRPSPFADPDRLVRVTTVRGDEDGGGVALPEFDDLLKLPVFEDGALYTDQGMYNASGFGTPEELPATITTHDLFRVLGVEPLIGSAFPAEFDRSRAFGLVISHGLWTRKFGRDPGIVGKTMTLDGAPGYTIYGVMPEGFTFPSQADLYRSNGISPDPAYYARRDVRPRVMLGRLRPGVSLSQAQSALDEYGRRAASAYPDTNAGLRFEATTLNELYTGDVRAYVVLLFGAVVLVLFVACANVANLLLSRAIARDREIAIRTSLGATRGRLMRQTLTESLVLAALGALAGLPIAVVALRAFTAMVPVTLPPWMDIRLDPAVAVFLGLVTILTGVAAGLAPALRTSARNLYSSLKEGARGSSSGVRQQRTRDTLIVLEVAFALVLLVGAGLLIQSVRQLHAVDLGFDPRSALTFRVELGWRAYGTLERTRDFHTRVVEALRALPGVSAVTFDTNLPLSGKPRDADQIIAFGQSLDDQARNPYVNGHHVGPDYFGVMGIAIEEGRGFTEFDRAASMPVVVVSRRLADALWPGRSAIGQRIQMVGTSARDVWPTVVGVSAPVLQRALDGDPGFDYYRPYAQVVASGPWYVIRTTVDPSTLTAAATSIIGRLDPNQSFFDVRTYEHRVADRIWQRRLAGTLFTAFAALALTLAAIGLYGALSYLVTQQTREIGVRMALGATPGDIIRMILRRGLGLATAGAAIGLAVALFGGRLASGVLYGVNAADPLTFTAVPAVLLAIAALACLIPARRALRVDPIVALRSE